jgi:hypothetical protein
MSEKRYWFLTYRNCCSEYSETRNRVTDEHPLEWLIRRLELEPRISSRIQILFYKEISKENYDRLKGYIG